MVDFNNMKYASTELYLFFITHFELSDFELEYLAVEFARGSLLETFFGDLCNSHLVCLQ